MLPAGEVVESVHLYVMFPAGDRIRHMQRASRAGLAREAARLGLTSGREKASVWSVHSNMQ